MNAKLRELDGSESIFDKSEVEARRVKVYGQVMLDLSIAYPEISQIMLSMREGIDQAFKKLEETKILVPQEKYKIDDLNKSENQ